MAGQPAGDQALGVPRLPRLVNLLGSSFFPGNLSTVRGTMPAHLWSGSSFLPGCDHLEGPLSGRTIHPKDIRVPEQQRPQAAAGQVLCQDSAHPAGESIAGILSPSWQCLQCRDATGLPVSITLPGNTHQCRTRLRGAMAGRPLQCLCTTPRHGLSRKPLHGLSRKLIVKIPANCTLQPISEILDAGDGPRVPASICQLHVVRRDGEQQHQDVLAGHLSGLLPRRGSVGIGAPIIHRGSCRPLRTWLATPHGSTTCRQDCRPSTAEARRGHDPSRM